LTRLPIFLLILAVLMVLLVAGAVWVVRSRSIGVAFGASIALALACVVVGGLFILRHSPECLLPGAVVAAGGVVALSMCTVALAIWVRPGGKV
jgi:hypothetical protein